MKKTKLTAALLVAAGVGMTAHGGVLTFGSNQPLQVSQSLLWDVVSGTIETYSTAPTGPWYIQVDVVPAGATGAGLLNPSYVAAPNDRIVVWGEHTVGPHPGEAAPNPNTFMHTFVLGPVPSVAPLTLLDHPPTGHLDVWQASVASAGGAPYEYGLTLTGSHPVPEPHEYALFAGLGLVAFGAYRRFRAS